MSKGKGDGFVKVGDFGLAKIVRQTITDTSSNATPSSRGIIGTPEFMSPEQMQPEMGVDKRADLYALGTIAYLMLGGKTPFAGDMMQLVMQKIMQKPPPLASLRSDIPADVDRVVMQALEIDPVNRPSTVGDWISQLEDASEDVEERKRSGSSRLVVMGPSNSEVYVNDERKGSIGSSGRVILSDIPAGRHILRVSKAGERDDERLIEVREGGQEQVIQAQLRAPLSHPSQSSPSHGSSSTGGSGHSSVMPGIVACSNCGSRFAEGVRFCGRCGSGSFKTVSAGETPAGSFPCPRCATQLHPNARFCGRCGLNIPAAGHSGSQGASPSFRPLSTLGSQVSTPSQAERLCQRCRTAYPPHIKFCGRCGLTLQ
jgi:serine/threonine protein kinase